MAARERLNEVYAVLFVKQIVQSKTDFAEKLGYNRSYMSELLHGRKEITDFFAQTLQNTFHISAEWLMKGKGDMQAKAHKGVLYDKPLENLVREDPSPYKVKAATTPIIDLLAEVLKDIDDLKKRIR